MSGAWQKFEAESRLGLKARVRSREVSSAGDVEGRHEVWDARGHCRRARAYRRASAATTGPGSRGRWGRSTTRVRTGCHVARWKRRRDRFAAINGGRPPMANMAFGGPGGRVSAVLETRL